MGVFQSQDPGYVKDAVEKCGLDMVQLHGSEGMAALNWRNSGCPPCGSWTSSSVLPTTTATEAAEEDERRVDCHPPHPRPTSSRQPFWGC